MNLVTVKDKYQVVIPQRLRKQLGVNVGDLLEVKVERGKITLTPQTVVDQSIAEGLEDVRKGRVYGPFDGADALEASLRANARRVGRRARARK